MVVVQWLNHLVYYIGQIVNATTSWVVGNDGVIFFNFASLIVAFCVIEVLFRVLFPKNR